MPVTQERHLKVVMAVANNPYPRDSRVRKEAESLAAAGYLVTVIAPRARHEQSSETINGVHVLRFRMPALGTGALSYVLEFAYVTLATAVLTLKAWLTTGLDVVHLHNPPDTLMLAVLLPRALGKKVVFDHHDLAPELFLAKFGEGGAGRGGVIHSALLALERFSCRLAHEVVTVNESYKTNDVERNGVSPDRVTVVRNGPMLADLTVPEPDVALRARAATLIGYLGSIAKQDGVDHLITALHELESTIGYSDWFAVIIGPADDFAPLDGLARNFGIRDKIWFTDYLPDAQWRRLLATVDLCVVPDPANPLNDKSTMIKFMEYMALGKPVVAYDLTENRASGGDAAAYAESSDPRDLARHMHRLAIDPELAAAMGAAGRLRVREGLAWEYSVERLLAVYRRLVPGTQR